MWESQPHIVVGFLKDLSPLIEERKEAGQMVALTNDGGLSNSDLLAAFY